jgi:PQQ-dependent dehydrogenase (methanol/ethanol family)
MSGGEMALRGFLDAYDPATGRLLWRFYTVPAPGEPGIETWAGDSWKYGAAATWLTGSYDPELNLLYWTTGNPAPSFNPDVRKGDNLYSDSVLALDPDTGKLVWHYQFTPNDSHDWDSAEDVVLADRTVDGRARKLLLHADRNGHFYVLDRTDGKFLFAKPFVHQSWNLGFDANGRPLVDPSSVATPGGQVTFPSISSTNFQAPSYDRVSHMFYMAYNDSQGFTASGAAVIEKGKEYIALGTANAPPAPPPLQGVQEIDSTTGKIVWKFPLTRRSSSSGVLGTRGGLLFVASADGEFIALDMKSGQALWHFRTGARITASPISYAVDGRQFVAVSAGNLVYAFALPD